MLYNQGCYINSITEELIFNKLVKYLLYIAFYSKEKSMSQSVSERTQLKVTVTDTVAHEDGLLGCIIRGKSC
jgi:hypothetical protein